MKTFRNTKLFKQFDYFGIDMSFRKSISEKRFKTSLGGFIFLLFFIIVVAYFIINFIPFYLRNNFNLILTHKSVVPNTNLNFNDLNLNLAFNLIYENNSYIQKEIQDLFVYKAAVKSVDNSTNTTILNLKKCESSDFYNHTDFDDLSLNKFFCFDSKNISIKGSYANRPFEYLEFSIGLNKSILSNNSSIYENLFKKNGFFVNIRYLDTAIDVENINTPMYNFIESYILFTDYWMMKKINMYYNSLEMWNDFNILYSDQKLKKSYKFEEFEEYSQYIQDRKEANMSVDLVKFYIRSSSNVLIFKRQFQKFTDYLANMTSITSQVYLILWVIVTYINSFLSKQNIMNKIINYKDFIIEKNKHNYNLIIDEIKNRNLNLTQSINNELHNRIMDEKEILTLNKQKENEENLNNRISNPKKLSEENIIIYVNYDKSILSNVKKPVDFKIIEIFVRIFKCGRVVKAKNQLYSRSLKKINYYLSIFTYIKTVQSLDILKYCLLNKEQISLFNYISRPCISFADEETQINHILFDEIKNKNKITYEDINDMLSNYKIIKKDNSDCNRKLLELFNHEMDRFIE